MKHTLYRLLALMLAVFMVIPCALADEVIAEEEPIVIEEALPVEAEEAPVEIYETEEVEETGAAEEIIVEEVEVEEVEEASEDEPEELIVEEAEMPELNEAGVPIDIGEGELIPIENCEHEINDILSEASGFEGNFTGITDTKCVFSGTIIRAGRCGKCGEFVTEAETVSNKTFNYVEVRKETYDDDGFDMDFDTMTAYYTGWLTTYGFIYDSGVVAEVKISEQYVVDYKITCDYPEYVGIEPCNDDDPVDYDDEYEYYCDAVEVSNFYSSDINDNLYFTVVPEEDDYLRIKHYLCYEDG